MNPRKNNNACKKCKADACKYFANVLIFFKKEHGRGNEPCMLDQNIDFPETVELFEISVFSQKYLFILWSVPRNIYLI